MKFGILKKMYLQDKRTVTVLCPLLLLETLLEGFGISLAIPVLYKIVNPEGDDLPGFLGKIESFFVEVGLDPSKENLLVLLCTGFVIRSLIMWCSKRVTAKFAGQVVYNTQKNLLKNVLNAKISYFQNTSHGELISAFSKESDKAASCYTAFAQWLGGILALLFYLGSAFLISPALSGIVLILGVIMFSPYRFIKVQSNRCGHQGVLLSGIVQATLIEIIGSIKMIKACSKESVTNDKFMKDIERNQKIVEDTYFYSTAITIFSQPSAVFMLIAVMIFGMWLQVPPTDIILLLMVLSRAIPNYTTTKTVENTLALLIPSFEKILEVTSSCRRCSEPQMMESSFDYRKSIEFRNVSFSYLEKDLVLKNINLKINKGDSVAIVGGSGQGKTTLLDLIMGFYYPTGGSILVDGQVLKKESCKPWRKKIAYVSQDATLFNDSIRNNLTWGDTTITDSRIIEACEMAGALAFIQKLELGFNTFAGERGEKLSGGQRQRIVIARSLLLFPDILIFDEATSALDRESELVVINAIARLKAETNITIIVVSHRPESVKSCDRVYEVKNGMVSERVHSIPSRQTPDQFNPPYCSEIT